MDIIEIIVILAFIIGIGLIIYVFLRDPIPIIYSILRFLKPDRILNKIVFLPIWGTIWIIDRIFKLKIYITDFEESSSSKEITLAEFEKYIIVNTIDKERVLNILRSFKSDSEIIKEGFTLENNKVDIADFNDQIIIKPDKAISFDTIKVLVSYLSNSASQTSTYDTKGILIHKSNFKYSFFFYPDSSGMLKGRTGKNRKIYLDYKAQPDEPDKIFFNRDIETVKHISFNTITSQIRRCRFKEYNMAST